MLDEKILDLQKEIKDEISKLEVHLLKTMPDKEKYIKRLEKNLKYILWVNKKLKLSLSDRKYTVAQREIYYCEFGLNIGSEQSEKRPTVILQNDHGNMSGNTTIVAPITSHENQLNMTALIKSIILNRLTKKVISI